MYILKWKRIVGKIFVVFVYNVLTQVEKAIWCRYKEMRGPADLSFG